MKKEKVVFDTNIYIDLFNKSRHLQEFDAFGKITYLVHPVLHELWIGAKGGKEIAHLIRFGHTFNRLKRLVQPTFATQTGIGKICQRLRASGNLDPVNPKHYNDVCIAMLSRQIGATLVTKDVSDFEIIRKETAFRYRPPH